MLPTIQADLQYLTLCMSGLSMLVTFVLGILGIVYNARRDRADRQLKADQAKADAELREQAVPGEVAQSLAGAAKSVTEIQGGLITKLLERLDAVEEDAVALRADNVALRAEQDRLQGENQDLWERMAEYETSSAKLQADLAEARAESARARAEAMEAKQEAMVLRRRNGELEQEIIVLRGQIENKADKTDSSQTTKGEEDAIPN